MTKSNKIDDFPVFAPLRKAEIEAGFRKIEGFLHNLSSMLGFSTQEIQASPSVLADIIERVEKRRLYFHIFHDGCRMGELNEGALYCFWILKLQPFYDRNMETHRLNARVAICLFLNSIYFYVSKTSVKTPVIAGALIQDLYYAFRYRDISKESLMLLASSIAKTNPVKEDL
jgi:hypothetical protein